MWMEAIFKSSTGENAEFTHENGEQWRFTHEIYTSREFTNRFNGQVTYINMGIFRQALFEPFLFAKKMEDVLVPTINFPAMTITFGSDYAIDEPWFIDVH